MNNKTKKCPFCGEEILATAKKCKYCKQFLPNEDENTTNSTTKTCPFCGEEIMATAKKCKHCKQFIVEDENNTTSESTTTSHQETSVNINKKGILGSIIGIILLCIIYNSSSKSFLNGCEFENETYGKYGTIKTYYCKNNNLYNQVNIYYTDGSYYPDYYFRTDLGIFAKYYRKDGEYYCSLYNNKDDIASCDETKMLKLIKANIGKINEEIELGSIKQNIKNKVRAYHRENQDYMDRFLQSPNCEYLFDKISLGIKNYHSKNCQAKFENGVIMSISSDGQAATIYNSETPKYYVNIKHNYSCEMQSHFGVCIQSISTIEDVENRIPADYYIKSYNNAKQLYQKEIDNINPRAYFYN